MNSIDIEYAEWAVKFLTDKSTSFRDSDITMGFSYKGADRSDISNIQGLSLFLNQIREYALENRIEPEILEKSIDFIDYIIVQYKIRYKKCAFRIGNASRVIHGKYKDSNLSITNFCEILNPRTKCEINLNKLETAKVKKLVK